MAVPDENLMEAVAPKKSVDAKIRFAKEGEAPVVSVCIITYNHQEWIREAIESVLMQETDFPCEVIIADDCSLDDTRKIIRTYSDDYPIKLIFQEKNKGAARNWRDLLEAPVGKYVAYFEGDDRWLDAKKLAKQYRILEEHPEAVLCYTNASIYDTKNPDSNISFTDKNRPPVFRSKYETVRYCPMPNCSIFYRNLIPKIPDWVLKAYAGDYVFIALLAKYGGIYYLDEVCGLYVHHYNGLSRSIPIQNFYSNDAVVYQNFFAYFDYDPKFMEPVIDRIIASVDKLFHMKEYRKAIKIYWKHPFGQIFRHRLHVSKVLKQGIKVHFLFFLSKGKIYR